MSTTITTAVPAGRRRGVVLLGAVVVLAGCSSASAVSLGDPSSTATPASSSASSAAPSAPSPSSSASASASAAPSSGAAGLTVTVVEGPRTGGRAVALTVEVRGRVPEVLGGDGTPLPADRTEVMGSRIDWGDGTLDGSDPGDVQCSTSGKLVTLAESFPLKHSYRTAGRYTFSFTAGACAPLKDVTRTLVVVSR